jgi:hypothetical protein
VRTVEFRRLLSGEDALRVRFDLEQGKVTKFVVQLECLFADRWTAVIRYDTAHGFAHCDRLHPYELTTKFRIETSNYNEALTFAVDDLSFHWKDYRERYELWLKRH